MFCIALFLFTQIKKKIDYKRIIYTINYLLIIFISLFISFILLTIGIYNGKLSFMEQFIIVYFIKLFFQGIIIIIGLFAATFIDSRYIIGTYNSERIVFVKVIFFILLIYGLEIYYYICVGSYTQFFAEEIEKSNEARKLESNENEIKS